MATIKVEGLDKLQKALKGNMTMDEIRRTVRIHGSQLQTKIQQNADFTRGYATGTTKRSVGLDIEDAGLTAVTGSIDPVENPETGLPATEYSPYLEYGTRFMDAQPFVRPAYTEQKAKFKRDMQKLVR